LIKTIRCSILISLIKTVPCSTLISLIKTIRCSILISLIKTVRCSILISLIKTVRCRIVRCSIADGITMHQTTRYHTSEDSTLYTHPRKNHKYTKCGDWSIQCHTEGTEVNIMYIRTHFRYLYPAGTQHCCQICHFTIIQIYSG